MDDLKLRPLDPGSFVVPEMPTLRDQFAMAALPGIVSNPHGPAGSWKATAEHAYALADAMLEARKQTKG